MPVQKSRVKHQLLLAECLNIEILNQDDTNYYMVLKNDLLYARTSLKEKKSRWRDLKNNYWKW